MDNENPTILNASDLPSRRRQQKRILSSNPSHGGTGLLSSVAPVGYASDPFTLQDLQRSEDDDSDGDDSIVDQIDAQEIYG